MDAIAYEVMLQGMSKEVREFVRDLERVGSGGCGVVIKEKPRSIYNG